MYKHKNIVASVLLLPLFVLGAPSQAIAVSATDQGEGAHDAQSVNSLAKDQAPEKSEAGYLWLHFSSSDYEKIYYGYSQDGLRWKTLNEGQPIIASETGTKGLRDPHLLKLQSPDAQGNKYVMLGTDLHAEGTAPGGSWDQIHASTSLVVAKSKDLVKWDQPRLVQTGLSGKVGNAWAPEAIWDEETQDYLVYWSSRDLSTGNTTSTTNLKVYKAHTKDFESFDHPEIWVDQSAVPGENIIDATIVRGEDGQYYRFSTSDWYTVVDTAPNLEANKWTRLVERDAAVSQGKSKVTGDQVVTTTAAGLYGSNGNEGLTLYQVADGSWLAMADHSGYQAYQIDKLASLRSGGKFTRVNASFDQRFRHGTVIRLTSSEEQAVLDAYDNAGPVVPDADGSGPMAAYNFEDSAQPGKDATGHGHDLEMVGNPALSTVDGRAGTALLLNGDGQYARFPKGLFDRRNQLTVQMDVKSQRSGNFFTFAFGQNSDRYYFLRYRDNGELGSHMSTGSWQNEDVADAVLSGGTWRRVTIVFHATDMKLYVDGTKVAENSAMANTISDLGTGLEAYLGKSFYADPYFKGAFDNVRIWNRSLSDDEVADKQDDESTGLRVMQTSPNRQILSQRISQDASGEKRLELILDYWTPNGGKDGSRTVKSNLNLAFVGPAGTKLSMADGRPLPEHQDLSKPFRVKVVTAQGEQIYKVTAQVLSTPIRVAGQRDGTGAMGMKFFADPQIVAEDGKYYLFPTTDGYSGWRGSQIRCFESDDLISWKDDGVMVDLKDQHLDGSGRTDLLPARTSTAWAPAFAKENGKYYLYFSGNAGKGGTNQTNVAVADKVTGPYVIQSHAGANHDGIVADNIDPGTFRDPATGIWYLTWGQGPGKYARLSKDMMSIEPGTTVTTNATRNIREGSYITARFWKGKWTYYYSYSIDDTNSPDYRVAYATATHMDGDGTQWTYRGEILGKDVSKGILGAGHHSIIQVPGTDDWYIAYHCFLDDQMRPRGTDQGSGSVLRTGNKREIRIARITYSEPDQDQVDAGQVPLMQPVPILYEDVPAESTPNLQVMNDGGEQPRRMPVGSLLKAQFNKGWAIDQVQWLRDGKPIEGAQHETYRLSSDDKGHMITARSIGKSTSGVLMNAQAAEDSDVYKASKAASRTDWLQSGSVEATEASQPPISNPGSAGSSDALPPEVGHGTDAGKAKQEGSLSRTGINLLFPLGMACVVLSCGLALMNVVRINARRK